MNPRQLKNLKPHQDDQEEQVALLQPKSLRLSQNLYQKEQSKLQKNPRLLKNLTLLRNLKPPEGQEGQVVQIQPRNLRFYHNLYQPPKEPQGGQVDQRPQKNKKLFLNLQ